LRSSGTDIMCGICGFSITNAWNSQAERIVKSMSDTLRHRGPDGSGIWLDKHVALGHRRLSIIDLVSGDQPMVGPNGCVVVFNGEIYNYPELRAELESGGRNFSTTSDTEVILACYEIWGVKCVERFTGMFAFALYDPVHRRLFLARDRLGKKPLFYAQVENGLLFGSEIKALLAHRAMRHNAELDPYALMDYFSIGYILEPKTIFQSVRKLPAGHIAVFRLDSGDLNIEQYWDVAPFFLADRSPDANTDPASFLELLDDAVRIRLRSDVPLGTFLSGGIDSSTITACVKKHCVSGIQAYCMGFEEKSYDESSYARLVAEHLGVELEMLDQADISPCTLQQLIWHLDEPFCDTSLVPTFLLSQVARRFVKVVVSGDGADEILAGYPTHLADKAYAFWRKTPIMLQKLAYRLCCRILTPSYRKVSIDYKVRRFFQASGLSQEEAHYFWRIIFTRAELEKMLEPELLRKIGAYDPMNVFMGRFQEVNTASFLDKSLYVDIKTWLSDDILVKVDRMSMANSLEVRSPFLDHRLVEFAAGLPKSSKMNGLQQKAVLKSCMKNVLPELTLKRRKEGFSFPTLKLQQWFPPPWSAPSFVRPDYRLAPEKEDITYKSFNLMVFSIWLKMYEHYQTTGLWRPAEDARS